MKNALKIIFGIIFFLLFPITAGLYFVWPSNIPSKGLKMVSWITYILLACFLICSKLMLSLVSIGMALVPK